MSDQDASAERKPSPHRSARTTGEWVKDQIPSSVLTLFAAREEQNDKKDTRVLYIVAGFGVLGWLGFLILGGYNVKTIIDTKNGKVEFEANEAVEAPDAPYP